MQRRTPFKLPSGTEMIDGNPIVFAVDYAYANKSARNVAKQMKIKEFLLNPKWLKLVCCQITEYTRNPKRDNSLLLKNEIFFTNCHKREFINEYVLIEPVAQVVSDDKRKETEAGIKQLADAAWEKIQKYGPKGLFVLLSSDANFEPLVDKVVKAGWEVYVCYFEDSIDKVDSIGETKSAPEYCKNKEGVKLINLSRYLCQVGLPLKCYKFRVLLEVPHHHSEDSVTHWGIVDNLINQFELHTRQFLVSWEFYNKKSKKVSISFEDKESRKKFIDQCLIPGQLFSSWKFELVYKKHIPSMPKNIVDQTKHDESEDVLVASLEKIQV